MEHDEFADPWGPTGRYGKVIEQAEHDLRLYGNAFIKINTEGEKPMAKIDWKKPLRVYPPGERNKHQKVYTFKSGKQRVVWIDDHVYPVDDDGRATAAVAYPGSLRVWYSEQIVENVPEEKFFVGLYRWRLDGTYILTNSGVPQARDQIKMAEVPGCQWVVDTRKSAEPPKAIAHDPKDWAVVKAVGNRTVSTDLLTGYGAQKMVAGHGGVLVRVRETPAPVDTARYIQLYRHAEQPGPWKINSINGRQEFTAVELERGMLTERCNVKVRD